MTVETIGSGKLARILAAHETVKNRLGWKVLITEVTTLPTHSTNANFCVKETAFNHLFPILNCPPFDHTTTHESL